MNKVITLTNETSKRLIAKAIVQMPKVQEAFNLGYIVLSLSTTCGFIMEELCGYEIARSRYCCRYISSKGACMLSPEEQIGLTIFVNGEMVTSRMKNGLLDYNGGIKEYLRGMGSSDVVIKSGNIMDSTGKVASLVGSQASGKDKVENYLSKEVYSIIPMTVSKTIPGKVDNVIEVLKKEKITKVRCDAEPSDMIILNGEIITEIQAAKQLLNVDISPVAMGGFGVNRSSTTFLLSGDDQIVDNAYNYLDNLKSEPLLLEVESIDCRFCKAYISSNMNKVQKKRGREFCVANE